MNYSQIEYESLGNIALITLNRPQYHNAIGRIMIEELDDAFRQAVKDDAIRCIVVAASGKHFCAGHDLGTPEKLVDDQERPFPEGIPGVYQRSWEIYIEPSLRWRNLPKPTIGAVHGYCVWGGWMLASTMDVLFASANANFLPGRGQYFTVPWDIGVRQAKDILLENRFIDAREAKTLGFVTRVFPDETLHSETLAYAGRVAENEPFDLWMTKASLNQAQDAQGFTAHIEAAHFMPRRVASPSSAQGAQLQSGQRRVAPIDRALRNQQLARADES